MDITTALPLFTLVGSGITWILMYPQKKRAEQLKNESSSSDQWKELFERSDTDSRIKDEKINQLLEEKDVERREKEEWMKRCAILEVQNARCDLLKCEVVGCNLRKPQTGY